MSGIGLKFINFSRAAFSCFVLILKVQSLMALDVNEIFSNI